MMISQNKRKSKKKVPDNPTKHRVLKSGLPSAYLRLLSLIFLSPDPLIHKASFYDKISS